MSSLIYNWTARHVLARALDYARGTRTMACLSELEKSQWWSRDEILELQGERLRRLVSHAYNNVPYYRQIFDERGVKPSDIRHSGDLAKLPILTKQLIRSNFDGVQARNVSAKEKILLCTGGSTGEPLKFHTTKEDQLNWGFARGQRALMWLGYRMGDKVLQVRRLPPYSSAMQKLRRRTTNLFRRILLFDPLDMSDATMQLWARKLEEFQPKFIIGYPSAVYLLGRFIRKGADLSFTPKTIIAGGEQLYDYQRDFFREVFRCETYGHYSSWEAHNIATECPEYAGYHIAAEDLVIEVVDDRGEPAPAGVTGRVLITNLHNYAMPFIRYDIGDSGTVSEQLCPCGRGLPLLVELNGRTVDIIVTRSGRAVTGMALWWNFLSLLGVSQFQIVQQGHDTVLVKLVMDREYTQEHIDRLAEEIRAQFGPVLGEDVHIQARVVARIPAIGGKRRIVISNLPTGDDGTPRL